jgi:predicted nucleic acid-binding protein
MKYLVDANVLSEPTKAVSVQRAVDWLNENEAELVVSPVVMGEIWRGVDAMPEGRKKQEQRSHSDGDLPVRWFPSRM